ncbi:SPRY domain-containing protein 3 isoform X1 [Synchiropus splendidus]|uniref:SPRY domain-containing protein 3 isoform X1 n=1 Tax=Synchiropus splendidus TaxID=270530 RepID=UPI00237ECAAC|nr:SPRY domain-containing protein 3 isoform X1 [Synchiropus splendidus]XP_053725156.1 SPRY domain-containing protein 3 isoform X1 [Synchiropus splendidus]
MDDINLHYRFLNWRRRIREIRDVRAVRYRDRIKRMLRDGDCLRYHGNSDEVGCFVAARPFSKRNRYFEVTIIDTGVRGMIAVGLVPHNYKLDHQPGWLPNSVAFHADDGKLYNGNTVGQQFGPKCCRGDRIGCGISLDSDDGQLVVFFTKNGKEVGSVEIPGSPEALFPAVGMHSLGEEVLLDLNAEWGTDEEEGQMIVDTHEEDWARLHGVKVTGTLLEYIGKGKGIEDVGLAQAVRPLNTRFHYYELEITDAGEKCYIALGLARRDYPKNRHPGWSRGSIAYHADDGKLFQGSGVGDAFGPRCFEGDIMGCGIMFPRDYSLDAGDDPEDVDLDMGPKPRQVQNELYANYQDEDEEDEGEEIDTTKVTVFFTRNGKVVGRREVAVPLGGFFPTIGMMSSGEKVRVDLHPLSG